MKKFKACIWIFFCSLFFTACNSQIENTSNPASDNSLQGVVHGTPIQPTTPLADTVLKLQVTVKDFETSYDTICTATALTSRIILTAAHCLNDSTLKATILIENTGRTQRIAVQKFRSHRDYDIYSHDIAIGLLKNELPKSIKTIKLPQSTLPSTVSHLTIAGYGLTENDSVINGFRRATKKTAHSLHRGTMKVLEVTPFNILLSGTEGAHSCFGDSGGPAFMESEKRQLIQVGISKSVVSPDCLQDSNYELIWPHLDWIEKNKKLLLPPSDVQRAS